MALIIFDVDGTLFQTDRVTVPAVQRAFAAFGLPVPDAEAICSFIGRPVELYLDWLARQCPPDRAQAVVDATNRLELRLVSEEGALYPGVRELLTRLREQGHALAICSNGPEDYVTEFLDAHGVRPLVDAVRIRGLRYAGKEDMLRELLALLPARPAVMVGDRADDVAAARANGALALGAAYGFSADPLEDADAVVADSRDLGSALQRLLDMRPGASV